MRNVKTSLILTALILLLAVSTPSQASAAAKEEEPSKDTARFRAAIDLLETNTQAQKLVPALETLRKGFPASRELLVEAAQKGSIKVRIFALQILGEKGDAETDLEVVAAGLNDRRSKVRLAAIMAIRRLGIDGYDAIVHHIPREKVANNRKMAVKALQHWRAEEAVPFLATLLRTEEEKMVRNFIVAALESLSRRKYGDDIDAWAAYVENRLLQEQAKRLLEPKK